MFRGRLNFFAVLIVIGATLYGVSAVAASNVVNVSATKMKYGPGGKKTAFSNQCWTKGTTQEYAQCLFPNGIRGNNNIIKVELQSAQMNVAQQQYDK